MVRRTGWIAVAVVTVFVLAVGSAAGDGGRRGKLSKEDRAAIAGDLARGDRSVTLLLDASPGQAAALGAAVESLGGTVRYSDDDLGYVRVDVAPEQADAVASLPAVQGIGLDQVIPLGEPDVEGADLAGRPDATTPAANPYLPTADIGAPQFVQAHPTYDGRGVTIGILDTGIDPTRPELQTALDARGRTVPKIRDWVASTDPETDGDGSWVKLDSVVAGGRPATFTVDSTTYTAPRAGSYGFGVFSESKLCPDAAAATCEMHNDVDRDGDSTDSFGVLVARGGHASTVYVDTNQDGSFVDSKPMREYRYARDLDYFGNAAVETRRVPYVVDVERDGRDRYVDIGIVSGGHGTHLAGIAAGRGFFGGAMDGVAPNAQLVSARACRWPSGCTAHALIEGMIYLAKRADVDVISMSIGSLPLLNDGNTPRCDLYRRLIDRTGTQIVVSAGNNGPGGATINDPAACSDVVSVAAYQSAGAWSALYGVATKPETFWDFSSRGPREDGGLAPTLSAPGAAVSSWPAWDSPLPGQPPKPFGSLPAGYERFQGTSMAAPEVAGAAALLLSAAEQERLRVSPAELRRALSSGARFVPGFGPDVQGNGLVQVGAAWSVLQQGIRPVEIESTARVATSLSAFLATPGQGPGLYVREGWSAGDSGAETITFLRHGDRGSGTYDVRWLGDPAFSSADTITLPPDTPVPLSVSVAPLGQGVHSALVQLDDPATPGVEYETMATIVAAAAPAAPSWSVSARGAIDRIDAHPGLVVRVPAGVGQLKVDLVASAGARVKARAFSPDGVEIAQSGFTTGSTSISLLRPAAGTWEIDVDSSQSQAAATGAYALTATILGAALTPASAASLPQDVAIESLYAPLTSPTAVGTAFASAFRATPTIADGQTQTYDVDVPAGATSVSARIGSATEPSSDLDLLLFNCTSGACVQAAKSAGGTSEESVSAANPAPGRWQVAVVGAFVPAGSTGYAYLDSWASPALGSVSVTPLTVAPWVVHADAVAPGAPGAGRFLEGFVQVKSGSTVVGQAEIDLQ